MLNNETGGPRLIQQLNPHVVVTAGSYFGLSCEAVTEEMLDIAYIWRHNGMKIRDIDIKNLNNRVVSCPTCSFGAVLYLSLGRSFIAQNVDIGSECVFKTFSFFLTFLKNIFW